MKHSIKSLIAGSALAISAFSPASAVPIQGNDPFGSASFNFSGSFIHDEADGTIQSDTTINIVSANTTAIANTGGYGTTDTISSIANFALNNLQAVVGNFLEATFGAFPGTGTDPDFDDVDQDGRFEFEVTDAALTSFVPDAGQNNGQTSFRIAALGNVASFFDTPPTTMFDAGMFSLVITGQGVDGNGTGSYSASITTPPEFASVSVPEPYTIFTLMLGLIVLYFARREGIKAREDG